MIIAAYRIHYPDLNVIQTKNLIKHSDYLTGKEIKNQNERKKYFSQFGENWFTDQSPLFLSMKSGVLDCNSQYGKFNVKIDKIIERRPNRVEKLISGQIFGNNITYLSDCPSDGKRRKCNFKCHCGEEFVTDISKVKNQHTKSCGCQLGRKKDHIDFGSELANGITFVEHVGKKQSKLKCYCGKEFISNGYKVKSRHTKSCGCFKPSQKSVYQPGELIGESCRYVKDVESNTERRKVLLLCKCGNEFVCSVDKIKSGKRKGCGCENKTTATHGKTESPEYLAWGSLKGRCLNPNDAGFKHYGERGITVSKEWENSFEQFYADMGPRPSKKHSIDRIENDGNYEKYNCRWATKEEQCTNRRSNVVIEYNGERKTMSQWAKSINMNQETFRRRLRSGWNIEKILTEPLRIWPSKIKK